MPLRLISIPISHYCEKARWALDRAGLVYEEERHLQLLHRRAARRAGGGETVPVLVTPDGTLGESAQIVAYADERTAPERRLASDDRTVAALEAELDERLGPAGRLWMYWSLHDHADIAAAYNCTGVPGWQRRLFPLAYPVMIRLIDRHLGVDDRAAAVAAAGVDAEFDRVAEQLADGRPYLLGERFTAADLTFAALAAPATMPEGYGVPLPRPDELPEPMAARVRGWREHPAGRHALRMFREERRA